MIPALDQRILRYLKDARLTNIDYGFVSARDMLQDFRTDGSPIDAAAANRAISRLWRAGKLAVSADHLQIRDVRP